MLTHTQMVEAYEFGVERSKRARANGSQHLVGWRMTIPDWQADGYSAVAEAIVADAVGGRWLSRESDGPDTGDGADVEGPDGVRYGVRWSDRNRGRLIVRTKDVSSLTMVLVVGTPPNQEIRGQILCADASQDRYWGQDCWWVPQHDLRPLPRHALA